MPARMNWNAMFTNSVATSSFISESRAEPADSNTSIEKNTNTQAMPRMSKLRYGHKGTAPAGNGGGTAGSRSASLADSRGSSPGTCSSRCAGHSGIPGSGGDRPGTCAPRSSRPRSSAGIANTSRASKNVAARTVIVGSLIGNLGAHRAPTHARTPMKIRFEIRDAQEW